MILKGPQVHFEVLCDCNAAWPLMSVPEQLRDAGQWEVGADISQGLL